DPVLHQGRRLFPLFGRDEVQSPQLVLLAPAAPVRQGGHHFVDVGLGQFLRLLGGRLLGAASRQREPDQGPYDQQPAENDASTAQWDLQGCRHRFGNFRTRLPNRSEKGGMLGYSAAILKQGENIARRFEFDLSPLRKWSASPGRRLSVAARNFHSSSSIP